ncbi:MAG TPA: hypothetical protein VH877_20205 [Polyangia bacterium]|nr:hypothetical protein [Polyangia bacterium]
MGGLGHYLEQEGIATTQISLVWEHTETIRPPRALYVPFEFGRPLGHPDDAAGQRQVMLAALRLLERSDVPVLEAYSAPPQSGVQATAGGAESLDGLSCMLHSRTETEELKQAVRTEVARLRPLHDAVVAARGGLPVGVLGVPAEELVEFVLSFLDGPGSDSPRPEVPTPHALKLAVDDLVAFYNIAASRCPGASAALSAWFWHKTALGKAIQAMRNCLMASDKPVLKAVAYFLMMPMSEADERLELPRILESYMRLVPSGGAASASAKRG